MPIVRIGTHSGSRDGTRNVNGVWFYAVNIAGVRTHYYILGNNPPAQYAPAGWVTPGDGLDDAWYANGRYFLRAGTVVVHSTDLVNWAVLPWPSGWTVYNTITWDGTKYIVIGNRLSGGQPVYATTTNLTTWAADVALPITADGAHMWWTGSKYLVHTEWYDPGIPGWRTRLHTATALAGSWTERANGIDDARFFPAGAASETGIYFIYWAPQSGSLHKHYHPVTDTFGDVSAPPGNAALYGTYDPGWGGLTSPLDDLVVGWATAREHGFYVPGIGYRTVVAPTLAGFDFETYGDDFAAGRDNTLITTLDGAVYTLYLMESANQFLDVTDETGALEEVNIAVDQDVFDVALALDAETFPEWYSFGEGAATADEISTPTADRTTDLTEEALSTDSETFDDVVDVIDALVTADDVLTLTFTLLLQDLTTASEEITADTATAGLLLTDTAQAYGYDDTTTPTVDVLDDIVSAFGTDLIATTIDVLETADASEEVTLSFVSETALTELALADDLMAVQTASIADATDAATAADQPYLPGLGGIAWVMTTDTGAAYWYSSYPFLDMVQVGDKVLVAGPDGISVLGANTDDGEAISAGVTYGEADFGSEKIKRVDSLWFDYSSDGAMAVKVRTAKSAEYSYPLKANPNRLPENGRVIPGKGLNGRYWSLTVDNSHGCWFEVNETQASVADGARRI